MSFQPYPTCPHCYEHLDYVEKSEVSDNAKIFSCPTPDCPVTLVYIHYDREEVQKGL